VPATLLPQSRGGGLDAEQNGVMEAGTHQAREQAWEQAGALEAKQRRAALREAVARGDPSAVLALLGPGTLPGDALQLIGDGLSTALGMQVAGAAELAGRCAGALRARRWRGDLDLADQLDGQLPGGAAPSPVLRPLPVSLEELACAREGNPRNGAGRLDLRTAQVWTAEAITHACEPGQREPAQREPSQREPDGDDGQRWLWIDNADSRPGYHDMQEFIDTVTDPDRAHLLGRALVGRGAFRRFKDVLARWPQEFQRWHAFTDERRRGRARAWLAAAGYTVAPTHAPVPADPSPTPGRAPPAGSPG